MEGEKGEDNGERSRMVQVDSLLCFFIYLFFFIILPVDNPSFYTFILSSHYFSSVCVCVCVAAVLISFYIWYVSGCLCSWWENLWATVGKSDHLAQFTCLSFFFFKNCIWWMYERFCCHVRWHNTAAVLGLMTQYWQIFILHSWRLAGSMLAFFCSQNI